MSDKIVDAHDAMESSLGWLIDARQNLEEILNDSPEFEDAVELHNKMCKIIDRFDDLFPEWLEDYVKQYNEEMDRLADMADGQSY